MWRDRKGFSLIEMVITIALLGILTGSAVVMFGHIRYADTKKAAEKVNMALSDLRLETMSKEWEKRPYLYIYRLSDGYYMKVVYDKKLDEVNYDTDLATGGTNLCGLNVTISDAAGGQPISGKNFICVAYTKSGLFYEDGVRAKTIEIRGNGIYTISLDGVSGRHYLK